MTLMTTTAVRPPARQPAKPLPQGAARWSKTWVDKDGLPHVTSFAVPVDDNDYRTAHVKHVCSKGHIDVTLADGRAERRRCDQEVWLLPSERKFCPDHSCPMEPTEKVSGGVLPWGKLWQQVEKPARPLWALAAVAAAGGGVQAEDPLGLAVAAPLAAAGVWWGTRKVLTTLAVRKGRIDPDQTTGRRVDRIGRVSRAAGWTTLAAGEWLAAAAAVDPSTLAGKVVWSCLPVAWAVCAAPWWRHVETLRNRPAPVEEAPADPKPRELSDDEKAAADAARLWDEAGIANTKLDVATWKRITCGWQAVVKATKRGALNGLAGDRPETIKKIAAAFDVPKSAVTWIEEHDDNPNCALLLVQPVNPLKEGQIWAGPHSIVIGDTRIEAEVGRFIDGTPMMEVLFRFDEGVPSELVLGSTGSGKSERLRLKLIIQRWASFLNADGQRKGLYLSFLHDPKRLNSYGEFRDAITGYGMTRDDAHIMIDAFLREMIRRYDMLSASKWSDGKGRKRRGAVKWNPMAHGPLLHAIWDEFHELAGDSEFVKKVEKLARYQRACGMGATLASHMGTIGDTGSQALRDMLAGGRATLLRTTSGLNAGLATGGQLTADPRGLPKVPGMTLVADGETATVMGRYAFIPDDKAAERMGERALYDWLFDDDNQPIGYPAEIPPETQEAFGPEFMEWMAAGRSETGRDGWSYSGTPAFVPTAERAEEMAAPDKLLAILAKADRPLSRKEIKADPLWVNPSTGEPMNITSTMTAAIKANEALIVKGQRGQEMTYALTDAERARRNAVEQERQLELDLESDAA
jgi:hypothetical protein